MEHVKVNLKSKTRIFVKIIGQKIVPFEVESTQTVVSLKAILLKIESMQTVSFLNAILLIESICANN
jgi:hypothetical protein